jgi:hypothetical protein
LFYGTKESANLDGKDLCLYEDNKEKFGKPKHVAGFNAALKEIEAELAQKVNLSMTGCVSLVLVKG